MARFHRIAATVLFAAVASASGCTLLHDLKPHRLWRLNRQPPSSRNAYFSVTDPLESKAESAEASTVVTANHNASSGDQ